MCAHVKDPISICRKRVGLTAGGMVTQKYCIHYVKPPKTECGCSSGGGIKLGHTCKCHPIMGVPLLLRNAEGEEENEEENTDRGISSNVQSRTRRLSPPRQAVRKTEEKQAKDGKQWLLFGCDSDIKMVKPCQ